MTTQNLECLDYLRWCNRCSRSALTVSRDSMPAKDGNYYGTLCPDCDLLLNHHEEYERRRLELVGKHSE